MRKRGRRPGDGDTRLEILEAARVSFAENGYDRTTIRGVAGSAGVDPSLVHHYFGTKEDLFSAAVELPFSLSEALPAAFGVDPDGTGERIARLFFSVWEQPGPRAALIGQLRHSVATGEPPAIAGFISREVLHLVARRLDGEDAELRVELAVSHLLGVAVLRYVAHLEPIASASAEELIAMIAPRIQTYLV